MRRFALPFALATLGAALAVPYAAIAEEPLAPYEGRPLPALVKQLLWEKSCDIPQPEANGDNCVGDVCRFTRSDGSRFKPALAPWMDLTNYVWAAGQNAIQPALVESRLATKDEVDGDVQLAVAIASGLTIDLDAAEPLVQLNPLLVRWAMREVLPPPDHPMCGQTAKELYQAAFSGSTRVMVDVYAQLKARGGLRDVKTRDIDKSFREKTGRYAMMCDAIAKKSKNPDEVWPRGASCWWWLRRAASGGTDELALLLGRAMRDYDPATFKTFAAALPRELRQKSP